MVNVIFNDLNYEILPKKLETFEKYCKILQWGRQHPTRFAEQFMNLQFTDMQKWIILSSWVPSTCVWLLSRGSGKLGALDTKIYPVKKCYESKNLTPPKVLGDLKIGDWIYDDQGKPTQVVDMNPIVIEDEYKVYFEDGEVIKCGREHLWEIIIDNGYAVIETGELYRHYQEYDIYVPTVKLTSEFSKDYGVYEVPSNKKRITKIDLTNKKTPMRCITVSNDSGLFLWGEHYTVTHNSYMGAIFLMLKAMLFPHTNSYILAPTGNQAQETFTKMENIAKNNIASAIGVTRVFLDETVKYNSKADPFTHDSASYTVSLYNGSTINTLNSVAKSIVGIRSKGRFEICRLNLRKKYAER